MHARDVQRHLRDMDGGWVDPDETVDTFKVGDPGTEVEAIAVAWMSTAAALERAADLGCDLFVTHEPTLYTHRDERDPDFSGPAREQVRRKADLVADLDMAVLRCHDLWDRFPEEGVPDSWGRQLLPDAERVGSEGYFRVFDRGEAAPARAVAAAFAGRIDQRSVELVGPGDEPVRRVCVGTGAATPFRRMWREYDADLYVCSDDGFTYWQDGALAADAGVPVVVANHGTSEEAAMASLAAHLDRTFDVPVHHLEQGCQFTLVGAADER
ncbi:MAG: Nif3-like dinuclear metal center hexameric protein [Haloarculaceae archaeon]